MSEESHSQYGEPKELSIPAHCSNLKILIDKLKAVGDDQLFQDRAYTGNGDWISILTNPPPGVNWELCQVTHQLQFSQESRFSSYTGGLLVETHTKNEVELQGKGLKRNLVVTPNQGEAWCIQPIVTTRSQLDSLENREQNESNPQNGLPLVGMKNISLEEMNQIIEENLAPQMFNPTHPEVLEILQRDPIFPNDLFIGVMEGPIPLPLIPSPTPSIVTVSPKLVKSKRDRLVKGRLPQSYNEFEVDHPPGGLILQPPPVTREGGGCTSRGFSTGSSG